ncbi:putative molybdenum cofactor guanylyltransferase [Kroppenstedtia guangzhouensis]|uniref:Probable molybdenum cofactor guanylyltransferase n=1 Tax=Kroppenstedtia guangzhouensis TaxID=1274356 RepID=A0ABQ1GD52_9BACL|nr:molybdenum cofactor guanylyltransferase [Kroppenstedtia guangzhouensis]GGA41386.1 putative molybdenum cofactor guanylyltransferase [Kroppenstedtia guangzhouensis]
MADGVQFAGLIILAGGQSRRMGRDKALLPLAGEIMVRRVIRRLSLRGKWAIMVSSNQPEKFPGLEVPVVPDQLLEGGPLAGIHACLETSPCEWNLVTACDLPFVSGEVAQQLLALAGSGTWDVVVPVAGNRAHPLFGVYSRRCRRQLEVFLKGGGRRVTDFLKRAKTRYVSGEFPDKIFFNMNRPEDYYRAIAMEKEIQDGG